MTLDSERVILVLDRTQMGMTDDPDAAKAAVDGFNSLAKSLGASGGIMFGSSVELPNDDPQPEGLTIHADELNALRWAHEHLDLTPVGGSPGELHPDSEPARMLSALWMLIQRAEQQR
jgi:hypothetical protein